MRRVASCLRILLSLSFLLSAACTKQSDVEIHWTSARFNERLRADLEPLVPADLTADLERGFFRDGSDGGLVSPLFPLAASRPEGLGHLVQTTCLLRRMKMFSLGKVMISQRLRRMPI